MSQEALSQLLQLEQYVRQAENLAVLSFCICNQTRQLVPYDQSVLLLGGVGRSLKAIATNDHSVVDRTSPLITWIEKEANQHLRELNELQSFSSPAHMKELSSAQILWLPLIHPANQEMVGGLWLARTNEWSEKDKTILNHLAATYAHAVHAFEQHSNSKQVREWLIKSKLPRYLVLAIILLSFIPVRLSVLAPAEIVAKEPLIITSPIQGVVKQVLVRSGDLVQPGQLVVQLDPQDDFDRYQIAEQEQLKAIAELRTAQQSGFSDPKQKARIAELEANIQIKEAEKNYAYQQWTKTRVLSHQAGMAIIDDPQSWQGRPVNTGERILQIADPQKIELRIMLPVADAIAILKDAQVQFFPDTDPLNIIEGVLVRAAYEPEKTPEDTIAYKLIAHLEDTQTLQRIGSRGTAKLYGERVTLFYYLFRRPITALRQWLGW